MRKVFKSARATTQYFSWLFSALSLRNRGGKENGSGEKKNRQWR